MDRATRIRLRQLAVQIEEARSVTATDSNADTRAVFTRHLDNWHSILANFGLAPGHFMDKGEENDKSQP